MDMSIFRGILTIILMMAFIGLVLKVYKPSQKKYYKDVGLSVLDQESSDN